MADLFSVLEAVQSTIKSSCEGLKANGEPIVFSVGIDWPATQRFHELTKQTDHCIIAILDEGEPAQKLRFISQNSIKTKMPTGIVGVLDKNILQSSEQAEITLSYSEGSSSVNLLDAIGLSAKSKGVSSGAVAVAEAPETLESVASLLATEINQSPVVKDWLSASAVGNAVTIQNDSSDDVEVSVKTGNIEYWKTEAGRSRLKINIFVFTSNQVVRKTVGKSLESLFGELGKGFGIALDGDFPLKVSYLGTRLLRDDDLKDLYKQFFCLDAEYVQTIDEVAYEILVGIGEISKSDQ